MTPSIESLEKTIRLLAEDSMNILWKVHSEDRLDERGISKLDALRVLQRGDIDGEIVPGKYPGEWKCKVVDRIKANRDVGVVTVVLNSQRLFVITVEWEDLR